MRRADTVLASNCREQFGRALTRTGMSHLCDTTAASPAVRRDNVLASKREDPTIKKGGLHVKYSRIILLCNLCSAIHDHYILYSLKIF